MLLIHMILLANNNNDIFFFKYNNVIPKIFIGLTSRKCFFLVIFSPKLADQYSNNFFYLAKQLQFNVKCYIKTVCFHFVDLLLFELGYLH